MLSAFSTIIASKKVNSKPFSVWSAGVFLAIYGGITALAILKGMDLFLWVAVAAITAIGIYCISPRLWVYTVLLSSYFFYTKGGAAGDESSSQSVIFAMCYHLSLAVWMFNHVLLKRKRLIRNWVDLLFIIYLAFLTLNCLIALSNGVEFMYWLKGWQLFFIVLYYYPLRELFPTKKSQQVLLFVCSLVLITQGIWNIYLYKQALSNFRWANQLLYGGVKQGAAVFTVASVVTLTGILYARKLSWKIVLLVLHIFCFAVLMISLARAAWVGYVFSVVIVGLFARGKYLRNFLTGVSLAITLIIGMVILFLGRNAEIVWNVASSRFSSSAGFATDPSYLSRINENEGLVNEIQEFPMGGVGLQKAHSRYDMITQSTSTNTYAHNNYLGMMEKLGIPLGMLYLLIIAGIIIHGMRIANRLKDPFYVFLATGSFAALSGMCIINFVGSTFDTRDGLFLLAVLFAFFFIAEREFVKQNSIIPLESTSVKT